MTYNNNNNGYPANGLGVPSSGFGGRTRLNTKRLSVALPPSVSAISESQVDNPTPRTSRSHLLAGLRTQPKTPGVPASAPYNQTQYGAQAHGGQMYNNAYGQAVPQTATGANFGQQAMNAGRQMYSLPEQVLAPPSMYDQLDEMDPNVVQQMQMTSMFLAQRQQQLQQQLATLTAATGGINLGQQQNQYQQYPMTPQTPMTYYGQQQGQAPMEVPGQPGVYLVFNPALQQYTYVVDQVAQQHARNAMSPVHQNQATAFSPASQEPPTPSFNLTPPALDKAAPTTIRSFTPPKKSSTPPVANEHVEPLPPPSATAFRRGHKKATSLAITPFGNSEAGPKTSSAATFGAQRSVFPPTPMTGTFFGPGAARAGDHPTRQPRGPPALEELLAAPTSKHDGSKNFASRQRRRALDSLISAGTVRRSASHSPGGSPVSERDYDFGGIPEEAEEVSRPVSRKMSPIGSEMQEKRGSGSSDGYFGLSSASSSDGESGAGWKQPPTPATPVAGPERKKMMLGVLSMAEKRRSVAF